MNMNLAVGNHVIAVYKTGVYYGELIQVGEPKSKVRVLAVKQHPEQGNLHHPQQVEVNYFHQRKALAEREVALVHNNEIRLFNGEIPAYVPSLELALNEEMLRMEQLIQWAEQCRLLLKQSKEEYFG